MTSRDDGVGHRALDQLHATMHKSLMRIIHLRHNFKNLP
jgi:hypothetical protein